MRTLHGQVRHVRSGNPGENILELIELSDIVDVSSFSNTGLIIRPTYRSYWVLDRTV